MDLPLFGPSPLRAVPGSVSVRNAKSVLKKNRKDNIEVGLWLAVFSLFLRSRVEV